MTSPYPDTASAQTVKLNIDHYINGDGEEVEVFPRCLELGRIAEVKMIRQALLNELKYPVQCIHTLANFI